MMSFGRICFLVLCWSSLISVCAQQPDALMAGQPQKILMTFPQIASGGGIRLEINLTNVGQQTENGVVLFRNDDGQPLLLKLSGVETDTVPFSVLPGGARKIRVDADGKLSTGYAVVTAEPGAELLGNIVYSINDQFDVSVSNSPGTTRAHLFVDHTTAVNSALALLNSGAEAATIQATLRDENGRVTSTGKIRLNGGQKLAQFVDNLLSTIPAEFTGSLHLEGDKPFHLLGLRQRLNNGSLASLPSSNSSYRPVGSQILYLVDTGIRLAGRNFSPEDLQQKSVYQLTGIKEAATDQKLILRNTNENQAVTLHCRFINDKCENYLDFLVVLECGQTLVFDPFELSIPATEYQVADLLFGVAPEAIASKRWTAGGFGSGRFIFSATAVGASLDGDDKADILFPNEIAPIDSSCGVTPVNTGAHPGVDRFNLHVCNAQPMAFDFLTASMVQTSEECRNAVLSADQALLDLTGFTRSTIPITAPPVAPGAIPATCTTLAPQSLGNQEKIFETMDALNRASECEPLKRPAAVVVFNGAGSFTVTK